MHQTILGRTGQGHQIDLKTVALCGLVLLFTILTTTDTAFADTVYVSDTRQVNVYQRPSASSPVLAIVMSGAKLDILETKDRYTHVRTDNGTLGWIRSAYLTKDTPAQAKLNRIHDQYLALESELKETRGKLDSIRQADREIVTPAIKPEKNSSSVLLWIFAIFTATAIGAGGFFAGIKWYKHRISKKLGGFSF
ncbi:MAG: TIGR04211 family SH3 domain-containing protein [Gammaproteobacteria bacterium]|nr:TIGR04211 family SH3 domain-containing protein [Gammaproteobacteria bacterium]